MGTMPGRCDFTSKFPGTWPAAGETVHRDNRLGPDVGSAEVAILLWRYRTGRTEPIFRNYPTEPISTDPKTTKERWWLI